MNPQMIRFYVHKMTMTITPLELELIVPPAATLVLILGLLMNQKAIVGLGCLSMIGLDVWQLSRIKILTLAFTGSRGLLTTSWVTEAMCFLMLLLILVNPEKPGARILAASVLALAGQIVSAIGPGHRRFFGNSELTIPGAIIYVMAVAATGMYCAGLKPVILNEFFRKSRTADSPGSGYGTGAHSRRRGTSGEEDIWKVRGPASEEKRERIRKLKELRDNGIMTKEEYDQMVDRIIRS